MRILLAVLLAAASASAELKPLDLPGGGAAVHAVQAADGNVHVVFGREGTVFHRKWDGKGWSDEVKVGAGANLAGECGPRIGVGSATFLGVVWQGEGLGAAVSKDGGKTWEATDPQGGKGGRANLPAIAGDGKGRLVAAWLDLGTITGDDECDLLFATLGEKDAAWSAAAAVNTDTKICPCCAPAMAGDAAGRIYLSCRGTAANIREIQLFTLADKTWKRTAVSSDKWKIQACPEAGAALGVSPDGRTIALAWRFNDRLQWTMSTDGGAKWRSPGTLAMGLGMEDIPSAAAANDGTFAFSWTADGEAAYATCPSDALKLPLFKSALKLTLYSSARAPAALK